MTTEDQVTFSLRFFCRFDEEVKAFVGYIPVLQVYGQSPTEEGLDKSVKASALRFILACADRGTLGDVLREGSLKEASVKEMEAATNNKNSEFVSVQGYKEAHPVDVTVPLSVAVMVAAHANANS
jgi:hypothetical protein